MKKLLLMFVVASITFADGVLLKLPYGIELGKKIPENVKKIAVQDSTVKFLYNIKNKFIFHVDSDNNIILLRFISLRNRISVLPKSWRVLGLKISSKSGTQKSEILNIIKKDGAQNIIVDDAPGDYEEQFEIEFDINKKYSYYILGFDKKGFNILDITLYDNDEY